MQRIQLVHGELSAIVPDAKEDDQMISIEGGACRLFTGYTEPEDMLAGHMVTAGYQVISPAGVKVWAYPEEGAEVAIVVSDFGK